MLATVTNRSAAPRGLATLDRGTALLAPGETALLDLVDHPLHTAWAEAGDVTLAPLPDKDAKAARRTIEARTDAEARRRAEALAGLPGAAPESP